MIECIRLIIILTLMVRFTCRLQMFPSSSWDVSEVLMVQSDFMNIWCNTVWFQDAGAENDLGGRLRLWNTDWFTCSWTRLSWFSLMVVKMWKSVALFSCNSQRNLKQVLWNITKKCKIKSENLTSLHWLTLEKLMEAAEF